MSDGTNKQIFISWETEGVWENYSKIVDVDTSGKSILLKFNNERINIG